jgi:hypothetical protein
VSISLLYEQEGNGGIVFRKQSRILLWVLLAGITPPRSGDRLYLEPANMPMLISIPFDCEASAAHPCQRTRLRQLP